MRGRYPLTSLALLLSLLLWLANVNPAWAHRLDAECRVLPSGQVQVEAWFGQTGDHAKGAEVRVYQTDQQLLVSGQLDEQGRFTFPVSKPEPLRVVISAGEGHRKELHLSADALATLGVVGATMFPESERDRGSDVPWRDVLAGAGFLLALAAFVLSVRNARHLKSLRRNGSSRE